MKKLIISVALLLTAVAAFAQSKFWDERNNEIAVSYGLSVGNIVTPVVGALSGFLSESFSTDVNISASSTGNIGLEYFHHLSDLFSVGGIVAYSQYSISMDERVLSSNSVCVLPAVKFHWYQTPHFSSYSKAAIGIGLDMAGDGVSVGLGGHLTLLGLEVGGQAVRVFGETGFGNQGFLCAGLRVRF